MIGIFLDHCNSGILLIFYKARKTNPGRRLWKEIVILMIASEKFRTNINAQTEYHQTKELRNQRRQSKQI